MNIILYVCDALRADHLTCYGYGRQTSPQLDALAKDGVLFENCFASSTWTRPSAASLLTGVYPAVHMTNARRRVLPRHMTRLSEFLGRRGYRTGGFSTMANVSSDVDFDYGFDVFHDLFREPEIVARRQVRDLIVEDEIGGIGGAASVAIPHADDIHPFLFPWLLEHRHSPAFSFVWSIEPHAPYIPPTEFRPFSGSAGADAREGWPEHLRRAGATDRQRLIDLYDDEIYYNDYCLGQLVAFLKQENLYDDTLLVVLGDHGEAFFEHRVYGHGFLPYDELIHVPLIMKLPYAQHAGARVGALAELIDVFPTLLAIAGLTENLPLTLQGHNLLPLIAGEATEVRSHVWSDTFSPDSSNQDHYLSVRTPDWKFIQVEKATGTGQRLMASWRRVWASGFRLGFGRILRHWRKNYGQRANIYLFDLQADPAEQNNVAGAHPEHVARFQQLLAEWQGRNAALATQLGSPTDQRQEDEELRRQLEALGYL